MNELFLLSGRNLEHLELLPIYSNHNTIVTHRNNQVLKFQWCSVCKITQYYSVYQNAIKAISSFCNFFTYMLFLLFFKCFQCTWDIHILCRSIVFYPYFSPLFYSFALYLVRSFSWNDFIVYQSFLLMLFCCLNFSTVGLIRLHFNQLAAFGSR